MKTYEETTRSILCRVKEEKKKRKRISVCVAAVCVCCAVTAALAGAAAFSQNSPKIPADVSLQLPQNETTAPTEVGQPAVVTESTVSAPETSGDKIRISAVSSSGSESQKLINGVKTPFYSKITIRDLRRLSGYEKVIIRMEEEENIRKMCEASGLEKEGMSCTYYEAGDCWISEIEVSKLGITYDGTLGSVECTTTSAKGNITGGGYIFYDYHRPADRKKNRIDVLWGLSSELVDKIAEDPDMKLSEISDTLTLEVTFKDGRTEVVVFDFSLDGEGNVYVTQQDLYIKK